MCVVFVVCVLCWVVVVGVFVVVCCKDGVGDVCV